MTAIQCPACARETTHDPSLRRVQMFRDEPSLLAIHALAGAGEGSLYAADEHEQARCKAWLDRLVDEHGNPKDDEGRTVLEHIAEENMLERNGSLAYIRHGDDRETMSIVVLRRARVLDRADLRAKLVPFAESYVDHLLDHLYAEHAGEPS